MSRPQVVGFGALSLLVALVLGGPAAPETSAQDPKAPAAYVGSKSCRKCHLAEFRSWEATEMGKAFDSLAPGQKTAEKQAAGLDPQTDYRTNADCTRCHAVGVGHEGGLAAGYDLAKDPERLLGVGCESCHGPGGAYLGAGKHDREWSTARAARTAALEAAGYVPAPGRESCVSCHNEDSPSFHGFDWEARKLEGLHERKSR
jgi:hypothetical protein